LALLCHSSHWGQKREFFMDDFRNDRFCSHIPRRTQSLREAEERYHELETKVEKQTEELRQTNDRLREEIRERRNSEQLLRLEEARLDALLYLSQISEASLEEITGFTLEQAITLTHSKIGFLGFMNEDESIYKLHAVSKDVVKECNVSGDPMQWPIAGAGIWADAIRERKTLFVNDYSKPYPSKKGFPPGHPYVERFMVVPVVDGPKIVTVAGVGNKGSDYDKSDERQIVLLLSGMWFFMQRNRSREELQRAYEGLEVKVAQRTAELAASAAALRESQEDLKRAQEVGRIGSWRLDMRCNVLTWSDETHRIFGVPKGTPLTYEMFLAMVLPEDRKYVKAKWNATLRGKPYDIEHRIVAEGKLKWIREKAYLELDDAGKLIGAFGIAQDITERKLAEQRIRKLNEKLERRVAERTAEVRQQADQLRALASQLSQAEHHERKRLARVLHDHIQQLLVAARMQLGWMKRDSNPERLQATAQGVDGILHEALDASRSLTFDLSPPALHEGGLIGGLSWLASRMLEKNRFTVNLRADNKAEPATEETRFLLFECVRELLFNAAKHAGVSEAQVSLLRTRDGQIRLIVSDRGKGFDPDIINKRRSEAATYGLFSIRERLAHAGGRMEIESMPGRGTRVTLRVAGGEAGTYPEQFKTSPGGPRRADEVRLYAKDEISRILIVDDHKIMREGLAGLLQFESGLEIVGQAADGPQAIELARDLRPDVIIMDVNLGEMNGMEATRRILADHPNIKVIGLSMHIDDNAAAAMREAGAVAYLTKGGPSEDLIEAIRACVPKRQLHAHRADHHASNGNRT
jgi:PAS domain S-box-containing protein